MSPERRRLALLVVVLAVVAVLSWWPSGAPAPVSGTAAPRPGRSLSKGESASIDPAIIPTLAPIGPREATAPVSRNIFRFYVPPTRVPTPVPPPPTPFPIAGDPRFIGPVPLPTPPPPTPIIPPSIPYKAVGLFGSKERPIVALEDNGRLINAREGDILDGRFILRRVNRESIDFAFVGLPNDITRRLPIGQP